MRRQSDAASGFNPLEDPQFADTVQDLLAIYKPSELEAEPFLQNYVIELLARWGRWHARGRAPALCFEAACFGGLAYLRKVNQSPTELTGKADAALARLLAGLVIDEVEPMARSQGGAVRQKAVAIVADEFLARAVSPRVAKSAKKRIKKRQTVEEVIDNQTDSLNRPTIPIPSREDYYAPNRSPPQQYSARSNQERRYQAIEHQRQRSDGGKSPFGTRQSSMQNNARFIEFPEERQVDNDYYRSNVDSPVAGRMKDYFEVGQEIEKPVPARPPNQPYGSRLSDRNESHFVSRKPSVNYHYPPTQQGYQGQHQQNYQLAQGYQPQSYQMQQSSYQNRTIDEQDTMGRTRKLSTDSNIGYRTRRKDSLPDSQKEEFHYQRSRATSVDKGLSNYNDTIRSERQRADQRDWDQRRPAPMNSVKRPTPIALPNVNPDDFGTPFLDQSAKNPIFRSNSQSRTRYNGSQTPPPRRTTTPNPNLERPKTPTAQSPRFKSPYPYE